MINEFGKIEITVQVTPIHYNRVVMLNGRKVDPKTINHQIAIDKILHQLSVSEVLGMLSVTYAVEGQLILQHSLLSAIDEHRLSDFIDNKKFWNSSGWQPYYISIRDFDVIEADNPKYASGLERGSELLVNISRKLKIMDLLRLLYMLNAFIAKIALERRSI